MMFLCELIDGQVVEERLYREGNTEKEVLSVLEKVQYGDGEWRITEVEEV